MQPNQEKPYATQIQALDVILGDQWTGAYDANGNPIYQTKGFPGSLFPAGNGAVALTPGAILGNPQSSGASNFGQPIALDQASFTIDSGDTLRLVPSMADSLTAAGSTQGTSYLLSKFVNIFTAVAPNTGAQLFGVLAGQVIEVWNYGANTLALYPPGGGIINANGANQPANISAGSVLRIRCRNATVGATTWLAG
jgi:hypothetical protein